MSTAENAPAHRVGRRPFVRGVENALGAVVLGWFVLYCLEQRESFSHLDRAATGPLLTVFALNLAGWIVNAAQNIALYRAEQLNVSAWESLVLTGATSFGNLLPMRIGTVIRGRYLKVVHGLRYARFGSLSSVRTVILVAATATLGVIGVGGSFVVDGTVHAPLLAMFGAMFVFSVGAFVFPLPKIESSRLIFRAWNDFRDGFLTLRRRPGLSALVFVLMVAQCVLLGARLALTFRLAGRGDLSGFVLLALAPLVFLVSFTAVTPGALGIREATIAMVTQMTGVPWSTGMFAGALDRAVLMATTAVLGGLSYIYVWFRLRRAQAEARQAEARAASPEPGNTKGPRSVSSGAEPHCAPEPLGAPVHRPSESSPP